MNIKHSFRICFSNLQSALNIYLQYNIDPTVKPFHYLFFRRTVVIAVNIGILQKTILVNQKLKGFLIDKIIMDFVFFILLSGYG